MFLKNVSIKLLPNFDDIAVSKETCPDPCEEMCIKLRRVNDGETRVYNAPVTKS